MKSNTALLTTAAKTSTDKTVLDYQAGVFAHISGDWKQHTQAAIHGSAYNVLTTTMRSDSVRIKYYRKWKNEGTYLTFSEPVSNDTFDLLSPDIMFATKEKWGYWPFGYRQRFGADMSGVIYVAEANTYRVSVLADDFAYLYINGSLAVDNGADISNQDGHSHILKQILVPLPKGFLPFRLYYGQNTKGTSGVDVTYPPGIVYTSVVTSTRTLSEYSLRMLMDYNDNGTPAVGAFKVPVRKSSTEASGSLAPIIVTSPDTVTVKAGTVVTFRVVVISSVPVTYQWKFDDVPIAGAVRPTYTVQAAPVNVGDYKVVVSNAYGSATSASGSVILSI